MHLENLRKDLVERVTLPLRSNLREILTLNPDSCDGNPDAYDTWLDEQAESLADASVTYFMEGLCQCAVVEGMRRPPVGRRQDLPACLSRCEKQHDISPAAATRIHTVPPGDLERHGIPPDATDGTRQGLAFPLELTAQYLGTPLQAQLHSDGRIVFGGTQYDELWAATRAACESVAGRWSDADMRQFWRQQRNGQWVSVQVGNKAKVPKPGSLPPGTELRRDLLGHNLTAEIGDDGRVWFRGTGHPGLVSAAEAALQSVTQEWSNMNGWVFWQYRDEAGNGHPLDDLRRHFWELISQANSYDDFWREHSLTGVELTDFVWRAVVGNQFPSFAREMVRSISVPLTYLPDETQLQWGNVLLCSRHAAEAEYECDTCRQEKPEPPPPIRLQLRVFAGRQRVVACRCSNAEDYWIPRNPSSHEETCPRCGARRSSQFTAVWTRQQDASLDVLGWSFEGFAPDDISEIEPSLETEEVPQ